MQDVGNLLDTINDLGGVLRFKVLDGILSVGEDVFGISDAGVDIREAFGIEGTLKDTSNNTLELLDVNGGELSLLNLLVLLEKFISGLDELFKNLFGMLQRVLGTVDSLGESTLKVLNSVANTLGDVLSSGLNNDVLDIVEVFGGNSSDESSNSESRLHGERKVFGFLNYNYICVIAVK